MEESNNVTAFQNVLNVFFVLQEEIYLPACLGIDNIDLFASRHIEEFMISSDMEDLIRGENIKISANETSPLPLRPRLTCCPALTGVRMTLSPTTTLSPLDLSCKNKMCQRQPGSQSGVRLHQTSNPPPPPPPTKEDI